MEYPVRAFSSPIASIDAPMFDASAGLPATLATATAAAAATAAGGSCMTAPIPRAPSSLCREATAEDPDWFPRPPTPPLLLGAEGFGEADGDLALLPTPTPTCPPGRDLAWTLALPTATSGSASCSGSGGGGDIGGGVRANEASFDAFEVACRSGSGTAASSAAAVVAAVAAAAAVTREAGLPSPPADCVVEPSGRSPREPPPPLPPPPPPPPRLPLPPSPAVLAPWVASPTVPPLPTPSRQLMLSPFMEPPPRSPKSSSVATSSSPPSRAQLTSPPLLPPPPPPPPPHRPAMSSVRADARPLLVSSMAVDDLESSVDGNSSNGSGIWGFHGGGRGDGSGGFPSSMERYGDPSETFAAVAAAVTAVGNPTGKSAEMKLAGEPLPMEPTGGAPPPAVLPPATDDGMGSGRTPPPLSVAAQLAAVEADANACRIALVSRLKAEQAARCGGDHHRRRRRRPPYNGTNGDEGDDNGDRCTGESSGGVGSGGNGGGPTAGEVRKRRAATRCENNRISARGARVWAARYREGLEGCLAAAAVAAADRERTVERLRAEVVALRRRLRG